MTRNVERAAAWMYHGVWGVLTRWFRVPQHPPALPTLPGEMLQSFRPAEGFLRYLKLKFWLVVALNLGLLVAAWISLTAVRPWIGVWLTPLALAILIAPQVLGYLAIHLRYDTTWYVLSQRSLRIRSGIWTISESTITFENIQNVTVESGPVERCFSIGNVIVDTAGGSSGGGGGHGGKGQRNLHRGILAGVSNGDEIRRMILSRLSQSKVTGLGDEALHVREWTAEHVAVLREIRDSLQ